MLLGLKEGDKCFEISYNYEFKIFNLKKIGIKFGWNKKKVSSLIPSFQRIKTSPDVI
jgi:hypothetical protein